jgi:hypothetical protein
MNRLLFAATLAAATAAALAGDNHAPASIGQPDYYGRLDMANYPPPQLIYRYPTAIGRVPTKSTPVYLHVPPGQAKNWRKHCSAYHACDERVLFVQDKWYNSEYVPRYQKQNSDRRDYNGDEHNNDHHWNQNDHRDDVTGNDHHWSQNNYRGNQNGYYNGWNQNNYHGNQNGYYNHGSQNDFPGNVNGDGHHWSQNNNSDDNHDDFRNH